MYWIKLTLQGGQAVRVNCNLATHIYTVGDNATKIDFAVGFSGSIIVTETPTTIMDLIPNSHKHQDAT